MLRPIHFARALGNARKKASPRSDIYTSTLILMARPGSLHY